MLRVLFLSSVLAFASGCTTLFDTSLPPEAEDTGAADTGADVTDGGDSGNDIGGLERNACGGFGELSFESSAAAPGDICGDCDGGVLVCNGVDKLRCVGDEGRNACGGCGPLAGTPGSTCGDCEDGYLVCDGEDAVACLEASAPNACGGCVDLTGVLGDRCDNEPANAWACDGSDALRCVLSTANACGGTGALLFDGEPAELGASCGPCADGRLACNDDGALSCVGASDASACGDCGALTALVDEPCGACGTWACAGGTLTCEDAGSNVCGGCEALSNTPGDSCSGGGAWVCTADDEVSCVVTGNQTNACGGSSRLARTPGERCGSCESGVLTCTGLDRVECIGDDGTAAFNSCGGCSTLTAQEGGPCGVCGSGAWECNGENALRCEGGADTEVRNPCGGCRTLTGAPGDDCRFGTLECVGDDLLVCSGVGLNDCGGTEALTNLPGTACGECSEWRCSGTDTVMCVDQSVLPDVCGNGEDDDCDAVVDDGCSMFDEGDACSVDLDCASGYCAPSTMMCAPAPFCGDGVLFCGAEECDDGNNENGDGCSSECVRESVTEFRWVGESRDGYGDCTSWEPNGVPRTLDLLLFTGDNNTPVDLPADVQFDRVELASGYTGTVVPTGPFSAGLVRVRGGRFDSRFETITVGRIDISDMGSFYASAGVTNVTGSIVIASGTAEFEAQTGTVVFSGTNIDAPFIRFHDLTILPGTTVNFAPDTDTRIANTFDATGEAGNEITLQRAESAGAGFWRIEPLGARLVNHVIVSDSINVTDTPIVPETWQDMGGNLGWGSPPDAFIELSGAPGYDLGEVPVGSSAFARVTLTNIGQAAAVTVDGGAFGDTGFDWEGGYPGMGDCNARIEPGERCFATVEFNATQPGQFSDTITIAYDSAGGASSLESEREIEATAVHLGRNRFSLTPVDSHAGDGFGSALDASADTVLVGAPLAPNPTDMIGAVQIFELVGPEWRSDTVLGVSPASMTDMGVGTAVGLDDTLAVVGAPGFDTNAPEGGLAFFFEEMGGDWASLGTALDSSAPAADEGFGQAVAISGDLILVGAPAADTGQTGSVDAFRRIGGTWTHELRLAPLGLSADDAFGASVAFCGVYAVVGAPGRDEVMFFDPADSWREVHRLFGSSDTRFGAALDCTSEALAVGAPDANFRGTNDGTVSVYDISGMLPMNAEHIVFPTERENGRRFGAAVAVSPTHLIIGAPDAAQGGTERGAVWLFELIDGDYLEVDRTPQGQGDDFARVGAAVSIGGDFAFFGAPGTEVDGEVGAGAVYYWDLRPVP